jgi:predicted transcriptional regulator
MTTRMMGAASDAGFSSSRAKRMLALLKAGPLTKPEITAALGLTHREAGTTLASLRVTGKVREVERTARRAGGGPRMVARWGLAFKGPDGEDLR